MAVDLNRLRERVLQNQDSGRAQPTDQSQKIYVNRDGQIVEGGQSSSTQPLSEVRQDTFAGRLEDDRSTVRQFLPTDTKEITTSEGVRGWVYEIKCELRQNYCMFVYYDGAFYQVHVISPKLEDHWKSPHTGHIFPDGRICFGSDYGNGQPTIKEAFAKSVLWANGISIARNGGGHFPFSTNNQSDAA
jgi:hypothetical protein